MREDIAAGLKKALERGVPIEKAVQTFINAGYNPVEVKQVAEGLTTGATSIANVDTGGSLMPSAKMSELKVPVKNPAQATSQSQGIPRMQQPMQDNRNTQMTQPYRQQAPMPTAQTVQAYSQQAPVPPQTFAPRKLNEFKSMQQPKKHTGLIITLIIILLLLIGGLIYLIFFGQELLDSLLGSP